MRVLFVAENYPYLGGLQEVVEHLALELGLRGHQVQVFSLNSVAEPGSRIARRFSHCHELAPELVANLQYKPVTRRHPERILKVLRMNAAIRELASQISRRQPEVVDCQLYQLSRLYGVARACERARAPLVASLHDNNYGDQPASMQRKIAAALGSAAAITFLSHATLKYFAAFAPAAQRATVISGGIEVRDILDAPVWRGDHPYLFCAARLNLHGKAIDVVLKAFALVAERYPRLRLLIAGEGPDRSAIEKMIADLGISQKVELLGVLPRERFYSVLKGAELFVLASRRAEGLGLVFLEAMAAGVVPIGSNSGGTPEIILEGETGLLLNRNEPEELAAKIRLLLDDTARRLRIAERARRFALDFGWREVASRYEAVLAAAAQQAAPSASAARNPMTGAEPRAWPS